MHRLMQRKTPEYIPSRRGLLAHEQDESVKTYDMVQRPIEPSRRPPSGDTRRRARLKAMNKVESPVELAIGPLARDDRICARSIET